MGQTPQTMSNNTHLRTWVSRETKDRFTSISRAQGVSESALLKRLVEALIGTGITVEAILPPVDSVPQTGRITVRLRPDDLLILRERATARSMPTATYVSLLVRSHLRRIAPLPDTELKGLKHAIGHGLYFIFAGDVGFEDHRFSAVFLDGGGCLLDGLGAP